MRSSPLLALLLAWPLAIVPPALSPAPAAAYSYGDTLTVIWRPLPNLPSLVSPGDTLTVWANAPSAASGWQAALRFASLEVPLAPAGGAYAPSRVRWELGFVVPPGTPEEVYDLLLTSDSTPPDTSRHAVKVLPGFRTDYYFAQISDTHLPEHTFSSSGSFDTADTSGMADFDAVIADLNVIHPEFILHTGDLVNEGELEEYLGMYEMGRGQAMLERLRDPVFVTSGNHDIGGWDPTPPPPGTARKDWWRYFGWPFLASPPPGDPWHSQDYSFDYGPLHLIGLEAYQNDGSYDDYLTAIYGAQSMTQEQMDWLAADVAKVPAGHTKLAFFHYDFGGTLPNGTAAPNFSQFNDPAALGLDGVIWGHNHGVAEASPAELAAHPFNLGIQSVIYNSVAGGRTFRIFRVHDGAITPGIMHHSGSSTDSLSETWSAPNDGTARANSVLVDNRFGESWEHAHEVFVLADHDSDFVATGGTIAQTIREGGRAEVYVDCVLPASGSLTLSVTPVAPLTTGVGTPGAALSLAAPGPDPFRPGARPLTVRWSLAAAGDARLSIYDVSGRLIATLHRGYAAAGAHVARWDGRGPGRVRVAPGVYVLRLSAGGTERHRNLVVVR